MASVRGEYAEDDNAGDKSVIDDNADVFGMDEKDLQEVARHMGHELSVHRKFYRLQDDVIELAKISKLLLAVESGKASHFSGMSLDDLDLNDLPEDEVWQDEEEDVAGSLSDKNSAGSYNDGGGVTIDGEGVTMNVSSTSSTDVEVTENMRSYNDGEGVTMNVSSTRSTDVEVTENMNQTSREKRKRVYNFLASGDTEDGDYIQPAEDDSSDSDGEVNRRIKKRKKCEHDKKVWTNDEKKLLMPLVQNSVRERKPPVKDSILKMKKETSLEKLPWLKIKYQVWAMAQSEMKKNKKIIVDLKLS